MILANEWDFQLFSDAAFSTIGSNQIEGFNGFITAIRIF